jgi:hypothetical protein
MRLDKGTGIDGATRSETRCLHLASVRLLVRPPSACAPAGPVSVIVSHENRHSLSPLAACAVHIAVWSDAPVPTSAVRYHCTTCVDFSLCHACKQQPPAEAREDAHPSSHAFTTILPTATGREKKDEECKNGTSGRPSKKQKRDDAPPTAATAATQAASMDTSEVSTAADECPICFNAYEDEDAADVPSAPAAADAASSSAAAESKDNRIAESRSHRRIRRVLNCLHITCCSHCLTGMVKGEPKSR